MTPPRGRSRTRARRARTGRPTRQAGPRRQRSRAKPTRGQPAEGSGRSAGPSQSSSGLSVASICRTRPGAGAAVVAVPSSPPPPPGPLLLPPPGPLSSPPGRLGRPLAAVVVTAAATATTAVVVGRRRRLPGPGGRPGRRFVGLRWLWRRRRLGRRALDGGDARWRRAHDRGRRLERRRWRRDALVAADQPDRAGRHGAGARRRRPRPRAPARAPGPGRRPGTRTAVATRQASPNEARNAPNAPRRSARPGDARRGRRRARRPPRP